MNTKKIIIFDMDGVIFDTIPFAQKTILESHPGMTEAMYKEIGAGNFHEEIKKYAHLKIERTDTEKEIHKKYYAEEKLKMPLFEGMGELLHDLHQGGYILALNTSAFERNCFAILKENNIFQLFDFIGTAEISESKVEKFKIIEEKYNVSAADLVFVTDTLGDLREADRANVPTIAVTWGVHDKIFFEREQHNNLIGIAYSVIELSDLIQKQ